MRKENKFLIGMITGIMPFVIALGDGILYFVTDANLAFLFLHDYGLGISYFLIILLLLGLAKEVIIDCFKGIFDFVLFLQWLLMPGFCYLDHRLLWTDGNCYFLQYNPMRCYFCCFQV
ncbi:MAG: hypothetical protein E4G94_04845 [ANME-2 cluster archaeon]|nr:MAG: hypothetical protein E4G94_04845 [ANME-2 cluster archaeon]